MSGARIAVGILIFPRVEVLDFCGPFEVFSVTRLNEERRREEDSPFHAFLVAERKELIETTGKMKVMADYDFDDCPPLHVLVVPGGVGVEQQLSNQRLVRWLCERASGSKIVSSVCTGALVLATAGILDGRRATTHWAYLDSMRKSFPQVSVESAFHVVTDGNIITSAGISAGIDMALTVVGQMFGEPVARATARRMEYPFPESNARRVELPT